MESRIIMAQKSGQEKKNAKANYATENSFWRRCCRFTLHDRARTERIKEIMKA